MYHLFSNSFGKVIKTLKVEKAAQYIWRTLYIASNRKKNKKSWPQPCIGDSLGVKGGSIVQDLQARRDNIRVTQVGLL